MTIVDKIVKLVQKKGKISLKEIYDNLKNHSHATIRGNLYRYLKSDKCQIKRIDKGVYSIIEIINVNKIDSGKYNVDYVNKCTIDNKICATFHTNFVTTELLQEGSFVTKEDFEIYDKMINNYKSLKSMILQGDTRDILKNIKTESIDCIITDPAYKVISGGNSSKNRPKGILSKNDGKIFKCNDIKFEDWLPDAYRILKQDSQAYIFTNFLNLQKLMNLCTKIGFKIHNLLVWEKNNATPNRWYMKNCEYILFLRKGKAKSINNPGSKTVIQVPNIIGNKIQETEKPTELIKELILNSTKEGNWVLDPFGGSFVSNAVCLQNNRKCIGIDIDAENIIKGIRRCVNLINKGTDRDISPVGIL